MRLISWVELSKKQRKAEESACVSSAVLQMGSYALIRYSYAEDASENVLMI